MMEFELSRTRLVLKVLTTTSWCQRNAYGKSVWPHLASAMWGQICRGWESLTVQLWNFLLAEPEGDWIAPSPVVIEGTSGGGKEICPQLGASLRQTWGVPRLSQSSHSRRVRVLALLPNGYSL